MLPDPREVWATLRTWLFAMLAVIAFALLLQVRTCMADRAHDAAVADAAIHRLLQDSLKVARARSAHADTVYIAQLQVNTRVQTRWDSVRIVDTVMRDSVVYVRREAADTTIRACRLTLEACGDARVALAAERDLLVLDNVRLESQLANVTAAARGEKVRASANAFTIGAVVGAILRGVF